ncbi:fatty acid desaturase family protein [Paraburkholderia sp. CI3]|uniref:fatty acid desaturase family protein n=1 Tax=Paraburkholderia sp. CI3 TaxID=2991060 RepID=UPI003D1FB002
MNPAPQINGRTPWRASLLVDLPSGLFLLGVAANTALIACTAHEWLRALLALPQALLLAGCQEAKHLCVHGSFLTRRRANDLVGTVCAALFGVNFVAYRYFHFQHHRFTCTEADPEGRLYALSWRTRWVWLLAPVEVPWVAFHINRTAWSLVPAVRRPARRAALGGMLAIASLLGLCAWRAPQAVLWAYAIPLALHSWFDFLLTQAEHHGVAVLPSSCRRDPGAVTHDVVLPFGLGWLNLHRSLHRVHHRYPSLRWFEAPARLRDDPTASPISYGTFVRDWLAAGPRLWCPGDAASPRTEHADTHSRTTARP